MSKPTYKLSATILNKWMYYEAYQFKKTIKEIRNYLKGDFDPTNPYFIRGNKFEEAVFIGQTIEHKPFHAIVKEASKQVWRRHTLEFPDFNIYLSGKLDAYNSKQKAIYDLKRTNDFSEGVYDHNVQHNIYFFLENNANAFYYLIGYGEGFENTNLKYTCIKYDRPDNTVLKETINYYIVNFIEFLKKYNLWELYKDTQKVVPKDTTIINELMKGLINENN